MGMDAYYGTKELLGDIASHRAINSWQQQVMFNDYEFVSLELDNLRHRFVDPLDQQPTNHYLKTRQFKKEVTEQMKWLFDNMTTQWIGHSRSKGSGPYDARYRPLYEVGLHLEPDPLLPEGFYTCVSAIQSHPPSNFDAWDIACPKEDTAEMLLSREDLELIEGVKTLEYFTRAHYFNVMKDVLETMRSIRDNIHEETPIVLQKIKCLRGKVENWENQEGVGYMYPCSTYCGGDTPDPDCKAPIDLDHDGKNDRVKEVCRPLIKDMIEKR